MKKKSPSLVHSGLSLVIVIFIVLCLAVFSALSLVTARSDYVLAQQEARRSLEIQAAENQAQQWLGDMDDALARIYASSETVADCLNALSESAVLAEYYTDPGSAGESSSARESSSVGESSTAGEFSDTQALGTLFAAFSISEDQQLSVALSLCWPAEERFYTIAKWLVENTGTWEGDQSIPVYVEETETVSQ